jgi:hypothetical protein
MEPTTGRVRPQGITILAVLAAIGGVVALLAGLGITVMGGALGALGTGMFGGMASLIGIGLIGLGVIDLAFAYGAWTLQPWGWVLGVASQIVSLAISAIYVISGDITGQLVSIVIAGVILYYLFTPNVKSAFGRA